MTTEKPVTRSWIRWFPGVWILLGVSLLVAYSAWRKHSEYPHQIKELAQTVSKIPVMQKRPVVNGTGTAIGLMETTEHGVGVFIQNIGGTKISLAETKDDEFNFRTSELYGWSPENQCFAFSLNGDVQLWRGSGSGRIGTVETRGTVDSFAWISEDRFAVIDNRPALYRYDKSDHGWQCTQTWPLPTVDGQPKSLVTINSNAVAWSTASAIWQLSLEGSGAQTVYSNSAGGITGIAYAPQSDEFLVIFNTNRIRASTLLSVSRQSGASRTIESVRFLIREACWLNGGRGYAYRASMEESSPITTRIEAGADEKVFFRRRGADYLVADSRGETFYAFAGQTNEPPSVWKCDPRQGSQEAFYRPWGDRHMNVQFRPAFVRNAPYGSHNARYVLVPPANFSRGKKYPLVIGLAPYQWTPVSYAAYAQCLANAGAFVALSGLTFGADDEQRAARFHAHTNNVLAIRDQLLQNPSVDPDRVFLFAFSQSTTILNDLVTEYPGRWRGIILLNPGGAPENLPLHPSLAGVLASGGAVERPERRFLEYQTELSKLGVPMQWHVANDSAHFERAQSTLRERIQLIADLVFNGHSFPLPSPIVEPTYHAKADQ